jgi:antitoxin ParD1/3/4
MAVVSVSLPAHLKAFIDEEVVAKGYTSCGEYIRFLVQNAHIEKHRERVEQLLLEGLKSGPATPMAAQDWKDIEREGLARLAEEKRNAAKSHKKRQGSKRPA